MGTQNVAAAHPPPVIEDIADSEHRALYEEWYHYFVKVVPETDAALHAQVMHRCECLHLANSWLGPVFRR